MSTNNLFYINIAVLNKDEVIQSQVSGRVGGPKLFGKLAGKAANAMISDDKFTSALAAKLATKVSEKIAEIGVSLDIRKRFQQGSFFVLSAQLTDVDPGLLLQRAKGEEFATKFQQLLSLLTELELNEAHERAQAQIKEKAKSALMTKLEEILPTTLEEQGKVKVLVLCRSEAEQAEVFFELLEKLNNSTLESTE
eukprot:c3749_g1_i1.p1 GENE.c3749_g1_i1~~c3749_g1_i1.p1  ORF type:complete len:205 (+),score=57.89 c3749_g1_i1:31-615(+)